jgi:hypothetical protein
MKEAGGGPGGDRPQGSTLRPRTNATMRKRFEQDGFDFGPYRSHRHEHDSWEDEELLFEDTPPDNYGRSADRHKSRQRSKKRWGGSKGDSRRETFLEDDDTGPRRRRRRWSA